MCEKIDFIGFFLFIFPNQNDNRRNMSAQKQTFNNKTFLCPVCHDTTLDGQVNHWVRNQSGCAVCPTLLGIACGVCGDCRHSTKKCLDKKREDRARRRSMYMSVTNESGGVVVKSGVVITAAADQARKVEELKRITADKPSTVGNKKKEIMRVFYS